MVIKPPRVIKSAGTPPANKVDLNTEFLGLWIPEYPEAQDGPGGHPGGPGANQEAQGRLPVGGQLAPTASTLGELVKFE